MSNPLIPKRRRRTTPAELAILEAEFHKQPLPNQKERAAVAQKVGMSLRAIQIWFQNRRQKEKKDALASSASYPSSTGSAPDPETTSEADSLETASTSSRAGFLDSDGPRIPSPPRSDFTFLTSSSNALYSRTGTPEPAVEPKPAPLLTSTNINREALATLPTLPFSGVPNPLYNPKAKASPPSLSLPFTNPTTSMDLDIKPVLPPAGAGIGLGQPYHHRSSTTSIIAAKKHVKKRPLGSHAPLARTPSLSHNFEFPPSPPKHANIAKSGASAQSANNAGMLEVPKRPELKRKSSKLGTTNDGRAIWVDSEDGEKNESVTRAFASINNNVGASVNGKAGERDLTDVWKHMESDPPSSFSPAPLTRKRVLALSSALPSLPLSPPSPAPPAMMMATRSRGVGGSSKASSTTRIPLVRAMSLGGASDSAGAERSRAGGEDACAELALERKRARMDSMSSSSSASSGKKSRRNLTHGERTKATTRPSAAKRRESNDSVASTGSAGTGSDAASSMGDLTFDSTTSGDTSMEVGTPGEAKGLHFPAGMGGGISKAAVVAVAGGGKQGAAGNVDDERECAELLLGLGGFF